MVQGYADLADLDEDDRIKIIGETVMCGHCRASGEKPKMIAFVVETPAKADRYIKKLQERFPGIRIVDRFAGPVKDTITVRVGAPLQ